MLSLTTAQTLMAQPGPPSHEGGRRRHVIWPFPRSHSLTRKTLRSRVSVWHKSFSVRSESQAVEDFRRPGRSPSAGPPLTSESHYPCIPSGWHRRYKSELLLLQQIAAVHSEHVAGTRAAHQAWRFLQSLNKASPHSASTEKKKLLFLTGTLQQERKRWLPQMKVIIQRGRPSL